MTKILLVDDKELILISLSKMLRNCGAEVTTVANGKDAIREIEGASYDICFLDVQLPDANGLDLMQIIRKVSPNSRIVIMTALTLNETQLRSLRDVACHYLPKPFELDHVQSLVAKIAGEQNMASEA